MSHTTDWTCRSCRSVLGRVRDGVLRPIVPVESVDRRGVARVACPGCGRVRVWETVGATRPDPAPRAGVSGREVGSHERTALDVHARSGLGDEPWQET
jgi:hypothetical protein